MTSLARMTFTLLSVMTLLCLVDADVKAIQPSLPVCTDLKGGDCITNNSGIDCPHGQLMNASCTEKNSFCCNVTTPGPPTCPMEKGIGCLNVASAIHCPQRLNHTCLDALHYCCNMTIPHPPNPEPTTCSHRGGMCQKKGFFCEDRIRAACPDQTQLCCGPTGKKPRCSDVNGSCIGNTEPYFCPHRVDATCDVPNSYCCGGSDETTTSQRDEPDHVQDLPTCADVKGQCVGNTWPLFCQQRSNATCSDPKNMYCCLSVAPPLSPCDYLGGQCIDIHSKFNCTLIHNAVCKTTDTRCCQV